MPALDKAPPFASHDAAKEGHARGFAEAVDWAFVLADNGQIFTHASELEYRRLAASKAGLNLVVGPNGPNLGERAG